MNRQKINNTPPVKTDSDLVCVCVCVYRHVSVVAVIVSTFSLMIAVTLKGLLYVTY